jgi:transcriptional regulator with XRE-family HTH domain
VAGGLKLPALKQWRASRGLSQSELAKRVDVPLHYVQRVEEGRRGCNPFVARKMAEVLEVNLEELRAPPVTKAAGTEGVHQGPGGPSSSKTSYAGYLHRAYLKLLLEREVGSAYVALNERDFERQSESLSVEELVEVISRRRRELEFLEGVLTDTAELHPQVRIFFEELVRERPDEDIRVLAAARRREHSQESRERLTLAMREFL